MEKILGQALRKEREARGVSLADIAGETRIGTRFLQALEDEEFDLFPGKFYIYYYIKNYLKACGADETAFFNTYQEYLNQIMKKGAETPPDRYMQKMDYLKFRKSRRIFQAILLLAVLALLAYLSLGPPRLLDAVLSRSKAAAINVPAFSDYLLRPEAEYCLSEPPLTASLALDAPCWLQLWRGGEKIAERTFFKGEVFSLHGYQLILVIANPQALRLTLNGREVSYIRSSPQALKLIVNPGNLGEILQR
jgi:transcriptional regulator with XRE-family HTH domain